MDRELAQRTLRAGLVYAGIAVAVFMLAFIGSVAQGAAAQAAFSVCYGQLFSLVTWTSIGLMGASAAIAGQNLGAGKPDRAADPTAHPVPTRPHIFQTRPSGGYGEADPRS